MGVLNAPAQMHSLEGGGSYMRSLVGGIVKGKKVNAVFIQADAFFFGIHRKGTVKALRHSDHELSGGDACCGSTAS